MINDENYINIQGWMTTKLGLSGNGLLIYAIIYGFSQDGKNKYHGSLEYLQEWTNSTRQGVIKALKKLIDDGLIIKEECKPNNKYYVVNSVYYDVNVVTGEVNKVNIESKQSLQNNIDNNLDNNKDIDISSSHSGSFSQQDKYITNKTLSDDIDKIVKHLNEVCGTSFKSSTATTKRFIKSRFNEGYTLDDFFKVIDYKYKEWGLKPKKFSNGQLSSVYLRPTTLFSPKFENYLVEANSHNTSEGVVESVEKLSERSSKTF